jgi:hypothetical protein
MATRLGLSVGESFAELCDASAQQRLPPTRWYLPRRTLAEGLTQALASCLEDGGQIQATTSLALFSLSKKQGTSPAFLVTTGFEQWLGLHGPITPKDASAHPSRAASALTSDLIFGITERTRADGSVETPVSLDDLQFLTSKLDMLKTKTIAVGLLHADRNPESEIRIRDFFRERGFQVFCSHEFHHAEDVSSGELARWWRTVHSAYASTAIREQREQIEGALGEHKDKWTIRYVTSEAERGLLTDTPAFATAFGAVESIAQWTKATTVLHLGLERFEMIRAGRGSSSSRERGWPAFATIRHRTLDVKPSSPIEVGLWPGPVIGEAPKGFEPGPMAFGKAHKPTVFDVLHLLERLEAIEAVSNLINEKSRGRILESLFTLSKGISTSQRVDPLNVARDLETALLERINHEINASLVEGEIVLTGALARSLHPRLKTRRPDLRFRFMADAEWAESKAAGHFDGKTASGGATK